MIFLLNLSKLKFTLNHAQGHDKCAVRIVTFTLQEQNFHCIRIKIQTEPL